MKEWYVFINGKCVGTVNETSEALARMAAMHKFTVGDAGCFRISLRFLV